MAKKKTRTVQFQAIVTVTVKVTGDELEPASDKVATAAENSVSLDLNTEDSEHQIGNAEITGVEIDWESLKPKPRG